MTDLEKRRYDVAFWKRKYEREGSYYALSKLKYATEKLHEAEIDAENKKLKIF